MDIQKDSFFKEMTNNKTLLIVIGIIIICGLVFLFLISENARELITGFLGITDRAILTLSPDSGTYQVGDQFNIDVLLNTDGENVVVVGAYIDYDPTYFEVVSIDTSSSVFQAGNTCLYSGSPCEIVNYNGSAAYTPAGKIEIVKAKPTPGVSATNDLVATITFRALAAVSPAQDNITFEFTSEYAAGDSDVILDDGQGTDILSGVWNAQFTITAAADTTPPGNVTNFQATAGDNEIELTRTNPSDSDYAGTKVIRQEDDYPTNVTDGIEVYDGTDTDYTDIGLTNGLTYYYTAFAYDEVPNYSAAVASAQDSATPQTEIEPPEIEPLKIKATLEGKQEFSSNLALDILEEGTQNIVHQLSGDTAADGKLEINVMLTDLPAGTYDFKIVVPCYLNKKVTNIPWPSEVEIEFDDIPAGNLQDNDNIINELDWSIMASQWHTADSVADINQDGDVNALDWHYLNKNWGLVGD